MKNRLFGYICMLDLKDSNIVFPIPTLKYFYWLSIPFCNDFEQIELCVCVCVCVCVCERERERERDRGRERQRDRETEREREREREREIASMLGTLLHVGKAMILIRSTGKHNNYDQLHFKHFLLHCLLKDSLKEFSSLSNLDLFVSSGNAGVTAGTNCFLHLTCALG